MQIPTLSMLKLQNLLRAAALIPPNLDRSAWETMTQNCIIRHNKQLWGIVRKVRRVKTRMSCHRGRPTVLSAKSCKILIDVIVHLSFFRGVQTSTWSVIDSTQHATLVLSFTRSSRIRSLVVIEILRRLMTMGWPTQQSCKFSTLKNLRYGSWRRLRNSRIGNVAYQNNQTALVWAKVAAAMDITSRSLTFNQLRNWKGQNSRIGSLNGQQVRFL